jgi:uncharacterized membrane protein
LVFYQTSVCVFVESFRTRRNNGKSKNCQQKCVKQEIIERKFTLKAKVLLSICAACMCAIALCGCSGGHQIIDSVNECSSCHSDKNAVDNTTVTADATQSNGNITVSAKGENRVYVCTPAFTDEQGSYYVPVKSKVVTLTDGSANIELDEGYWVIAKDNGGSSDNVLVEVSPEYADGVEISL